MYQDKRHKAREAMRALLFEPDYRQVMCNCVAVINPKLRYAVESCTRYITVIQVLSFSGLET